MIATGMIKSLNKERGFGFIRMEDGTEIFFHRTALPDAQFDFLDVGQGVEFEIERGRKGLRAINVKASKVDEQAG